MFVLMTKPLKSKIMEKQIMYKYNRMELEQFAMFEENYDSSVTTAEFQTEAQFSFDKEQNILCSAITVCMLNKDKMLLKAKLKSYFNIMPESVEDMRVDGRISFAPQILVQFASFCYGSMRGVMYAKSMGTPLCNFILPPVYFGNLIDKGFVVE